MKAILLYYMLALPEKGGLGFDTGTAGSIYGLYTAMVYMVGLPGGWIADNFLGARRSVLYGGFVIMLGHIALAVPGLMFFYLGLVLIILGTGLLKPNISTIVGGMYNPAESARRDAGFSIFYMGINLGAFVAPLVCGYLGENIDWHLGFGAAAVGMAFGLLQYVMTAKYLGEVGLKPNEKSPEVHAKNKQTLMVGFGIFFGLIALAVFLSVSGIYPVTIQLINSWTGVVLLVIPLIMLPKILMFGGLDTQEKSRFGVIGLMMIFSVLFWAAFEQAGSSLALFAKEYTNRMMFGNEIPASWFQSFNPLFIVAFAPVFAWFWVKLGKREPSTPSKFAYGVGIVGLSFIVMSFAMLLFMSTQQKVSPMWLISVFLLQTFGELCLSPVGLSMVTKLAPKRYASQAMGLWFFSSAMANYVAGNVLHFMETLSPLTLFQTIAGITITAGLILALFVKPIRKMMAGIH